MRNQRERATTWLTRSNWLAVARAAATFVQWAALALVLAVVAIGIAPKSPVQVDISMLRLPGPTHVAGAAPGVIVDPAGRLLFKFTDPSFAMRMLNLGTTVPGSALVAEIARRMANLLRAAQHSDPFTARTARELTRVAKITAFGGLGVWAAGNVTRWALSSYVLESGPTSVAAPVAARLARRRADHSPGSASSSPVASPCAASWTPSSDGEPPEHRIEVHLDELLAARGMTLVELSAKVGVTVANLSILKNGHARALRFTTLTAICDALAAAPASS